MIPSRCLTVSQLDRSETFEFRHPGQQLTFGRDEQCDIVVSTHGNDLSRVAGAVWREQDELWVRNLSYSHELWVEVPGMPAGEPMRVRHEDGLDPGFARAVGAGVAYLRAPGGCLLICEQTRGVAGPAVVGGTAPRTIRVSGVPPELRPVAAALCEPLLNGGRLPAAYREIVDRLGGPTMKQVRGLVDRLCRRYEHEIPELAWQAAERRRRQDEELAAGAPPVLRGGVWIFPDPDDGSGRARRKALALPDYYEVAHFLVRRRLITTDDLAALPPDE